MKRKISLFLAILMLVSLMCTAPVTVGAEDTEAQEISVYFENNWLWADVFYHSWGSSLDTNTNWGSGQVEKVGTSVNGYEVYRAVVGSDAMGVIFAGIRNDGTGQEDQTPNIEEADIFDGACYSMVWDDGNATVVSNIIDICPDMGDAPVTDPEEETTVAETETVETDPTEAPLTETITIYFENNWLWEVPMIYWYGNETGDQPQWPGIEMTAAGKTDNGYDRYAAEVPIDVLGIVFSGNEEQSEDVLAGWFDGVCYYMLWDEESQSKFAVAYDNGFVDPEETVPEETTEPTEETEIPEETEDSTEGELPSETYTVYYVDSGNFFMPYAYAWSDGKRPNGDWPGEPMVLTDIVSPDGSPVYSYTTHTLYEYIVFSDGSDLQTEDLQFMPDKYLWWSDEVWYDNVNDIQVDDDGPGADDIPWGTAVLEGYTIGLGGNIAINYFYTLAVDVAESPDTRVVFTVPDSGSYYTLEVPVSQAKYDGTYYIFTCNVDAKEMTSVVKSQLVSSVTTTQVDEYTIKEYAVTMLSDPIAFEAEQSVVKAMLNYGAAAQIYFDYNTDNLANDTEYMTDADKEITERDLTAYEVSVTGNTDSDYFYGATLCLESKTSLKLYFVLADAQDEESVEMLVDGSLVNAVKNGNIYELVIESIPAHLLGEAYVVQTGDIRVEISAFSYIRLAQQGGNLALRNVSNALAEYSVCANAYGAY